MPVSIVEIIGRSEQGMTRPFICRGEDGAVYFVKGTGAGRRSQILEWVAGNLALTLNLPIAPFELVDIPVELIRLRSRADLSELGCGIAFGSRRCRVVEITETHVAEIPLDVQRSVLAFDWWIRNEDRTLSERGGNPNLFWNIETEGLVVIDHNQAFDQDFQAANFLEFHAFSEAQYGLFGDWLVQQEYAERFRQACNEWPSICNTVPAEWLHVDPEQTVPVDFDFDLAHQTLLRCQSDTFWNQE